MDVCTKTLCLKYCLKPNNFPGQRGPGGAVRGHLLPFLGLLVSGLRSCCYTVAHLEAALMEKLYFIHVMDAPAYKTQTGAVRCWFRFGLFFFSRNCSRCHLRCIHVQLVWLSSGFLLYYTCHFLYIHIYVWFRASDAEVHSCVASLRKSIKYYLMHVNFIFNTISKVNCRKHITIHHGIINWYRMCGEKAISQNH